MMVVILNQIGLPSEYLAVILAVDRILDMVRTVINVTGDATVTCIVARSEGTLDDEIFQDPDAGVITDVELPHKAS
jgi:Na+/H+-dicarboxylate symporter